MKHLDLFSGIGGFALSIDSVMGGVEHTFCDSNTFCQKVLKKHWPNSIIYGDIRTVKNETADIVTGGFPCQPFSIAGKQRGKEDDRFLWHEMFRVIKEVKPSWVIGENVAALTRFQEFEDACSDLEREGYEVQPFVIPACAVGANHRRDRVWIVAYSDSNRKSTIAINESEGQRKLAQISSNAMRVRRSGVQQLRKNVRKNKTRKTGATRSIDKLLDDSYGWKAWPIEPFIRREDDGIPNRIHRCVALGNSIVPQVAREIFKAITQLT